jgi:hypothetical protein
VAEQEDIRLAGKYQTRCSIYRANQLLLASHPDVARVMWAIHADFDAMMDDFNNPDVIPENMELDVPLNEGNESSEDDVNDLQVEIAMICSQYRYVYLTCLILMLIPSASTEVLICRHT